MMQMSVCSSHEIMASEDYKLVTWTTFLIILWCLLDTVTSYKPFHCMDTSGHSPHNWHKQKLNRFWSIRRWVMTKISFLYIILEVLCAHASLLGTNGPQKNLPTETEGRKFLGIDYTHRPPAHFHHMPKSCHSRALGWLGLLFSKPSAFCPCMITRWIC